MKIAENKVVVLNYAVSDSEGTLIDSSYDHAPLNIIQGSGYLIPGLESALIDHQTGDKFDVAVSAEQAYGQRDDNFVQSVPKELFESVDDIAVGSQLRATTDDGEQTVIVVEITEDTITVDGNHPLAGMDLNFEVEIMEVRDATEEELAHGHVHGAGGCGHNHNEEHGEEKEGCCGGEGGDDCCGGDGGDECCGGKGH